MKSQSQPFTRRLLRIFTIEVQLCLGAALACFIVALFVTVLAPESSTFFAMRALWVAGVIYLMIAFANVATLANRISSTSSQIAPPPEITPDERKPNYIRLVRPFVAEQSRACGDG